jgi:hypothetical protein
MPTVSEDVLKQVATRVAQQIHRSPAANASLPERFDLLVLSGSGDALGAFLATRATSRSPVVAIADCPGAAADALATARARIPSMTVLPAEALDADAVVARAERVAAPAMDLALASRVASLQNDTPGSRLLLRALFRGVPVEATLDEHEFHVSSSAPEGARRAVEQVETRLRALGLSVSRTGATLFRAAGVSAPHSNEPPPVRAANQRPHPSQDRFELPRSVDEFVDFLEKKGCSIEPGKPCIDCGACETRGF